MRLTRRHSSIQSIIFSGLQYCIICIICDEFLHHMVFACLECHDRQVLRLATTVKPAVAATSIKRDPPISGPLKAPRTILNANAPLLSVHLSNAASGQQNSPKNTESVSLNGHLLSASLIKFHQLTFLHRSYAWCNLTPQQWCLPE